MTKEPMASSRTPSHTSAPLNSITEAVEAIGINRTTLIERRHRLEADLDAALFHRATADGQPHHPTRRGTVLLQGAGRSGGHQ